MDKTIKYSEVFISQPTSKETTETNDNILEKIENEYGKDFNGSGFAMESFDRKRMNNSSNK